MTEPDKTEKSCEEHNTGTPWSPLRKWWQFGRIFPLDVGLPPVLEPGDPRWRDVDSFRRNLAACFWPGSVPAPLFVPHISGSMHYPDQKTSKWRVSMDVAHFYPSEISLSVRDGFLEVGGKHEERPDEHGFIARCFMRKYRLPDEMDATKLVSTLSVDGVLTVEAPLPETSAPAVFIIPIEVIHSQVESDGTGEPEAKIDDKGEESRSEGRGDQGQPSSPTAGLEKEDEETQERPAGETHPSVPAEDKSLESLQQSSEHHETTESQEIPSNQLRNKELVMDGGIQVEERAEELYQAEEQELGKNPPTQVQSQELEATDIQQQLTE